MMIRIECLFHYLSSNSDYECVSETQEGRKQTKIYMIHDINNRKGKQEAIINRIKINLFIIIYFINFIIISSSFIISAKVCFPSMLSFYLFMLVFLSQIISASLLLLLLFSCLSSEFDIKSCFCLYEKENR
jgi:hypothetical protein